MKSIRFFLVVVLLATMTLVIFLSVMHGYRSSMSEVKSLLDTELADRAHMLGITGLNRSINSTVDDISEQYAFQLWQGDDLLLRSVNAPEQSIASGTGFNERNFGDYRWRTYTWSDTSSNIRAIAAERIDIRNTLAEDVIMESVMPVIAILPIAGILIWFIVGYGMAPLSSLAEHLRRRRADDLSALPIERQPAELVQVINSTNDLLYRLGAAFAREQQFASDAAHELRTPISALKVHLYNIGKGLPQNNAELAPLIEATDRMSHLVEQILLLYRTSPDQYSAQMKELDLHDLVQEIIANMYPEFEQRNLRLELEGTESTMAGDSFSLQTLVKNLLDNACKYTPHGGKVTITVRSSPEAAIFCVEDSGPGVPEKQLRRIFDRFYRLGGDQHQSGVIGCGLGLAIAQHIAELHGATIEAKQSATLGGLAVTVSFPQRTVRQTPQVADSE